MSNRKRNKNGNNNQNFGGLYPTLFLVLRLEFAIELGRIRIEKKRSKTLEAERQIASLFKEAYDLVKCGASRIEVANVLYQIKEIGQRYGFIEDHKSEEEKEDPG